MINPRTVQMWSARFSDRARGVKFYRAGFEISGGSKFSAVRHRTRTEAEGYGARVILRWMRLYDAAVAGMVGDEQAVDALVAEPTA